ncbi:acetyltransferase (GNAT) family protein [Aquimarina brevivitae]|uniref:Acetyltransferase (GNAT) family protein n=1 Tax=Aquimarina brevivitae TaxID=323412 RepID=A0A4Q7NX17_9FLAO|nr:acetyltransferase (GNAT) family protein [Aquimarina brevivitae]
MYSVQKYTPAHYEQWNSFVADAKNGTFLFHRDFMEYHSDRFEDHSLLFFHKEQLRAVLPANRVGDTLYSHQGLTYGGLVLHDCGGKTVRDIFQQLCTYLKGKGFKKLEVKAIPLFYHQQPANELYFEIIDKGGQLFRRDLNLAIDYRNELKIHKSKVKHFRKRQELGFTVLETPDVTPFWNEVLIPRLQEKHQVHPVHTVAEMNCLRSKFPKNIKQYEIWLDDKLLAGITTFETDTVVKSQYGATTALGEKHRALDYLFITLIEKYKDLGYRYFDMGTVTEGNMGLLKQKEELGCAIYTQDFYELKV